MREERETCGVPSGIRLMNLLRERLTEIMDRERANRNSIHLYCTGPYWVAFERSAYQLHRAFPDSETTPLRLFAYPFPIVMVSVTEWSRYPEMHDTTDRPNTRTLPSRAPCNTGVLSFGSHAHDP